jgi:hypothetical protein
MEEKILEARGEFNKVIDFVTREALNREIHVVEGEVFRMLLRIGLIILELFLRNVGAGHVGRTVTMENGSVLRYRRTSPRKYLSIFGEVTILRAYFLEDGSTGVFPLEAQLNLPKRKYSYLLQKWMTLWGVRTTYEGAVETLEEFLGLDLAHRPIQRVARDLTASVNEFNDSLEIPEASEEGPILIETLDGKGIPMCKPNPDQPKTPDKPGKKKMALVTATLSADPHERRPVEEIADGLVNEGAKTQRSKKTRRPKPHHKRIIASLTQDRSTVMNKVQEAAMSRIHPNTALKAVLGDGEKNLWKFADELFPDWIQVLDIVHVRDKLWIAAHLSYKKESPDAKEYVRERLVALLTGEVDMIIEDCRIAMEDGSLSASKAETLRRKVLGYFVNNRDRMQYDKYLAMGLPIASGVIEGTCKNLINDRMERSGMRWSPDGAEAILKLRSLVLTDLWNDFWTFRTQREKKALYTDQGFVHNQLGYQYDVANAA